MHVGSAAVFLFWQRQGGSPGQLEGSLHGPERYRVSHRIPEFPQEGSSYLSRWCFAHGESGRLLDKRYASSEDSLERPSTRREDLSAKRNKHL